MIKQNIHDSLILDLIHNSISIGVIILDRDNNIIYINTKASDLLNISSVQSVNANIRTVCPKLFVEDIIIGEPIVLTNGKKIYIETIESYNLSNNLTKVLLIKEIYKKDKYHILENIINTIDEAVMACDANGRLIIYNDANQKLDNLLREEVIGQSVTEIYKLNTQTSLLFQAMKEKKPILNKHQSYITYMGKHVDTICSTYPLFNNDEVIGAVSIIRDYSKIVELTDKVIELQEKLSNNRKSSKSISSPSAKYFFEDIIGSSKVIKNVINIAKRSSASDSSVLIYGETGTGKELFAQSIHNASKRAAGPFIAINCAAIPENLLEGILFGTVKGSFTGAIDKPGLFEQADGGTLFFDELNSMSIGLQSKLLRVLQEGVIRRVGGINEIPVNVRIISVVNVDPINAIAEHTLRQDLFYRLSVVYLQIPSLRDRREDIPLLAKAFIEKYNSKLSKNVSDISPDVMRIFMEHSWPGNIRELQHAIESAINIMDNDECIILPKHIPQQLLPFNKIALTSEKEISYTLEAEPLSETIENIEKQVLHLALERNNWNISSTAQELGIKRQSLQYRLKKYDIRKIN
ncbi:MAG: modulated sigma-54 specific transcriptional regulator [Clostridia bacterium]|nr:modulated sigma-54 specific transcriptional regulator [Clostridia bacterium]